MLTVNSTNGQFAPACTRPANDFFTVFKEIAKLSEQHGLAVANIFHAGDGNLHTFILFDANHFVELEKAEQLGGYLRTSVAVGGTITDEHGVVLN